MNQSCFDDVDDILAGNALADVVCIERDVADQDRRSLYAAIEIRDSSICCKLNQPELCCTVHG
jgi:hypothetical protein